MLLAAGANVKATTREGAHHAAVHGVHQRQCGHHRGAAQGRRRRQLGEGQRNHRADDWPRLPAARDAVKTAAGSRREVNAKESVHGQTALMFAAALNRDAVVSVLLAHRRRSEYRHVRSQDGAGALRSGRQHGRGSAGAAEAEAARWRGAVPRAACSRAAADEHAEADGVDSLKMANDAQKSDLDALAHSIGFKTSELSARQAEGRAGDVAARARRARSAPNSWAA